MQKSQHDDQINLNRSTHVLTRIKKQLSLPLNQQTTLQILNAFNTNNLFQKKMVYYHLLQYTQRQPYLNNLVIKFLKKDCMNASSKKRAISLRYLCNLKSPDFIKNVLPNIQDALLDPYTEVKNVAIMGCLKLFYFDHQAIYQHKEIIYTLVSLVSEQSDPLIFCNALAALNQISPKDCQKLFKYNLIKNVLQNLKIYSREGKLTILNLMSEYYIPQNQNQLVEIWNSLNKELKYCGSAALILSILKIYLKFRQFMKQSCSFQFYSQQIITKIVQSLFTFINSTTDISSTIQNTFVILQHIYYIISNSRTIKNKLQKHFRSFYFRADDPIYIKKVKLRILNYFTTQNNIQDIITELSVYAGQNQKSISTICVQILTQIGQRFHSNKQAFIYIIKNLVEIYRNGDAFILNNIIISFEILLRKSQKLFLIPEDIFIERYHMLNEIQSKISFISILGKYSIMIKNSPSIIDQIISNSFQQFNSIPTVIKNILLTNTVRMFLQRPSQMYHILCRLFNYILTYQQIIVDLKQRASFYYHIMQNNIEQLGVIFEDQISCQRIGFEQTIQESPEFEMIGYGQFNSLCTIYHKSEQKFIKKNEYYKSRISEQSRKIQNLQIEENSQIFYHILQQKQEMIKEKINTSDLQQNVAITLIQFQSNWINLSFNKKLILFIRPLNFSQIYQFQLALKQHKIITISNHFQKDFIKMYLYSQHNHGLQAYFTIELDLTSNSLILNTKCNKQSLLVLFQQYFQEVCQNLKILQL